MALQTERLAHKHRITSMGKYFQHVLALPLSPLCTDDCAGLCVTCGGRLADAGPSPHESAAQQELKKMVQKALMKVSVELREAVILRDLQDLDYKEIAQVLGIPEGTVKSRISRGRAELARLLERSKREVM